MALIIDNDDCLTHILEYLPSCNIWSIIHASPTILRNHQLYRCAWEPLKKRGAPLALAIRYRGCMKHTILLVDRYQRFVEEVESLDWFHRPDIHELVTKADIGFQLTPPHDIRPLAVAEIDGRWLDLLLPLRCLKSLTLHPAEHSFRIQGNAVALSRLPVDLAPLLPRLASFGFRLGRERIRRPEAGDTILQMIGQMVVLKSLEIPSYMLEAIVNRLPELAHRLRELKIYQAAMRSVPCGDVIGMITSGSFPELRQLEYRHAYDPGYWQHGAICEWVANGEACRMDADNFGALTQLRELSVDCWQFAPSANLATALISLQHVHLHVTVSNSIAETSHLLISRFYGLRQISFHLDRPYYGARYVHRWLSQLLTAANVAASLREVRITDPRMDGKPRNGYSFLIGCLKSCRLLELVDMSYPVVSLTGFATCANGGPRRFDTWKLRTITDELASMPSIRNVRFVAKIDSMCAVRAALPSNAKIIDFQTKPREAAAYPKLVELVPGEEFIPTRFLILGQKDGLTPKHGANYSDEFYIRVEAFSVLA